MQTTEQKHTQGKWEVAKPCGWENAQIEVITYADSRRIVIVECGREGNMTAQANARLIASAPDLYAVARQLVKVFGETPVNELAIQIVEDPSTLAGILDEARAALSTTGEPQ